MISNRIIYVFFLSLFAVVNISGEIKNDALIGPYYPPQPPPHDEPPRLKPNPVLNIHRDVQTTNVTIKAYLHNGISETEYQNFIDLITVYFQTQALDIVLTVNEVIQLNSDEGCGLIRENNDVINCVGPGEGGYFGPPTYSIGLNTNPPYGFNTEWGLHAAAHEFSHFLGIQDLYWLKTDPTSSFYQAPNVPWPNELMYDVYVENPALSPLSRQIISENLVWLQSGGVDNMIQVVDRMPDQISVRTTSNSDACRIHTRERHYDTFSSLVDSISELAVTTNDYDLLTIPNIGGVGNNDSNYDLYFFECDSGTYWTHSFTVDEAYFTYPETTTPQLTCTNESDWCLLTPVHYSIYLPLVNKQNAPSTPTPISPSNLVLSNTTQDSITLTWQDNSDNETGFYIYNDSGRIATEGVNATSYTATGLNPDTEYCYYVTAFNAAGESEWSSNIECVTTPAASAEVGHWSFDEGAGSIAYDTTSNSNDGTIYNAIWVTSTRSFTATTGFELSFDGSGDYVQVPHSNSLDLNSEMTIAAWVKPASICDNNNPLVQKDDSYGLKLNNLGQALGFYWGSAENHASTTQLTPGTWYHIAATFDGRWHKIYVNGVIENSEDEGATDSIPTSTNSVYFAKGAFSCDFDGSIDEVHIYERAMTAQEIQDLMSSTSYQ
ncbi:MAG: hypothetical protein GY847_07150 [Proteobacteria bacterium]|nr:hypothetical protein [Pseudomonadota bacterium]